MYDKIIYCDDEILEIPDICEDCVVRACCSKNFYCGCDKLIEYRIKEILKELEGKKIKYKIEKWK